MSEWIERAKQQVTGTPDDIAEAAALALIEVAEQLTRLAPRMLGMMDPVEPISPPSLPVARSASERVDRARKLLHEDDENVAPQDENVRAYERYEDEKLRIGEEALSLLREFVSPAATSTPTSQIAANVDRTYGDRLTRAMLLHIAVQAGIQAAHESWEPADVPTQEFMLKHLGLDYEDGTADDGEPAWYILPQTIEKEG